MLEYVKRKHYCEEFVDKLGSVSFRKYLKMPYEVRKNLKNTSAICGGVVHDVEVTCVTLKWRLAITIMCLFLFPGRGNRAKMFEEIKCKDPDCENN